MVHATGLPFAFGRPTAGRSNRPIHVVLDVFFAAPDHFHRSFTCWRDLDASMVPSAVESPTEPYASDGCGS